MRGIKYRKPEEMKDSGVEWIGKVPKEWDIIKGKNLYTSKKIINRGGIKDIISLTLKGVIDRDPDSNDGLQPKDFNSYQEFKKNDLVFKLIDLENINTSRVGIVHKDGLMSPAYIRLIKKPKKTYNKFYYYLYYSFYTKNIYNNIGNSGVRSSMNSSDLLNMGILCLSYFEQQQVANFLDIKTAQFDSIISKKENLIEKLEEAKKSLISEIVTGKVKIVDGQMVKRKPEEMKDSGVEWLGVIPKEWEVKKLKYIAFLKSGETITNEAIEQEGPYPVYGGNGLRGYTNKFTHKGKHILIGRQGALCGNINYAENKFWASEHAVVVNIFTNTNIIWLGELLRSMELNQYSISAAQPGLSVWRISNLHIPYPPKNIQDEISIFLESKLKEVEDLIMSINIQIQKLKEAKQSLISEAVTGKIDLRDWEITEEGGA